MTHFLKFLFLTLTAMTFLAGCVKPARAPVQKQTVWWQPKPGLTWQWQLNGKLNTSYNVAVYDIDLFDAPAEEIAKLHERNIKVICYFSAGTYEDWRPDAAYFPDNILGKPLADWPDERWLDISKTDVFVPIMTARLDLAKVKGCDAVEPDNVDGYDNDTGFRISLADQLKYNRWLAETAHQRGLAIGLKNSLDLILDLIDDFDFAVNEQCFEFDECEKLLPFIQSDKAVFGVEYALNPGQFCEKATQMKFSWLKMSEDLDGERLGCEFGAVGVRWKIFHYSRQAAT